MQNEPRHFYNLSTIKKRLPEYIDMGEIEIMEHYQFETLFSEYAIKNKPVIIKNFIQNYPLKDWDLNYLSRKIGDKEVAVSHFSSDEKRERISKSEPFKTVAELIEKDNIVNGEMYIEQCNLNTEFPDLEKSLPLEDLIPDNYNRNANLWVGPKETTVPLHYDIGNNIFLQLQGEKEFTLFSSNDTDYLYPNPADGKSGPGHVSQVDIFNYDLSKFPNTVNATPITFTLKAGEMLFIPCAMWHKVTSQSASVSVNIWWNMIDLQMQQPTVARLISLIYPHLGQLYNDSIKHQTSSLIDVATLYMGNKSYTSAALCYLSILEQKVRNDIDCIQDTACINGILCIIEDKAEELPAAYDCNTLKEYFLLGKQIIEHQDIDSYSLEKYALELSTFVKSINNE